MPDERPSAPATNPDDDTVSVDAIVRALYDVISGPQGEERDWDRFRSLFTPGARLIHARPTDEGGAEASGRDVETFIRSAGAHFKQNGFFESEIARIVERFGNIAHVFSSYEARRDPDDAKPFARGINSIQLMKDAADRWLVVSMLWDDERDENPLPAKYLPRTSS